MDRKTRRLIRRGSSPSTEGLRYNKPRSRTGQPEWFRQMKFMAEVKKTLSKAPLDTLLPNKEGAANAAMLNALWDAGYKNVWDLSQASRADLLKVHTIGPATLKKVHTALVRRSVPVLWKAE